jgi:hypothetical protein
MDYFSHHIGNVIITTDFHSIIFQSGRAKNHQTYKDSWDPWISLPSGGEIHVANWKIIILNR